MSSNSKIKQALARAEVFSPGSELVLIYDLIVELIILGERPKLLKARLLEAHKAGGIELAETDMPQLFNGLCDGYDSETCSAWKLSSIKYRMSDFRFIRKGKVT